MPSFSDGHGSLSIQNTADALDLILEAGNVTVADEGRPQLALSVWFAVLDFKIKNAYAIARFALINAPITCADHDAVPGLFFAADIDHRMSDRRISLDRIRSRPKEQVARL